MRVESDWSNDISPQMREIITEIFEAFDRDLDKKYGTRELYFFSREAIWLSDICRGSISGTNPPFFAPLKASFFYLLQKNHLEEAEKIYRCWFKGIKPAQLIGDLSQSFQDSFPLDYKYDILVNSDQMISFFAQLGYEDYLMDTGINPLDNPEFLRVLEMSWVKLFRRFLNCRTVSNCHLLLKDLFNSCNKLYVDIDKIKSLKTAVTFRKWLLKRQVMGIYTAILVDVLDPEFFRLKESENFLQVFKQWVERTYFNYLSLLSTSLEHYVEFTQDTLKNLIETRQNHENILENLIHQVKKISYRYSDVHDLLKSTLTISFSFDWAAEIETHLRNTRPQEPIEIKETITWLGNALEFIRESNRRFQAESRHQDNLTLIREKISANGENSFWAQCQEKFDPYRLRILVASLDNKYSTGSAHFFNNPVVKLDKGGPIATELCLLKKWGSTSSIFERDKNHTANFGGGYLLYHNGFGLAIDPGPDFLKNLTRYTDFDLMDIGGVVCTHTHYDHYADFFRIVLGIREYNQYAGYKRLYYLLPDADDHTMFPEKLKEDFCINIFRGVAHPGQASVEERCYYLPDTEWGRKNGIQIKPIEVVHEIYGYNPSPSCREKRTRSHGLLISPLKEGKPVTNILFSGDAEYDPTLFSDLNPEVLILNISSIRFNDITALPTCSHASLEKPVKKNHLGYAGILSLLKRLKGTKVSIISDFFESQSEVDSRLLILSALESEIAENEEKPGNLLLVSEPGMRLRWDDKNELELHCSVLCGQEGGFVNLSGNPELSQRKKELFPRTEPIIMCCRQCRETKSTLGLKE